MLSLKAYSVTDQQILQLFRRIADQEGQTTDYPTTVLITSHDLAADAFADEVYHLQHGRITDV